MKIEQIIKRDDPALEIIKPLYEETFPLHERRLWEALVKLTEIPEMRFCSIAEEEQVVGFVIYWKLEDFLYIEHLAIINEQRGKKIGQHVIEELLQLSGRKLVLETELPASEVSVSRIGFYKRLGLFELPYHYNQPPYRLGERTFPMLLMASKAANFEEFKKVVGLIKEEVYEKFY